MARKASRLVYSTDSARNANIDRKGKAKRPAGPSLAPEKQMAGIRREKKGRRGKTVTVIHDLQLTETDLKALAKKLKAACGTGGSAKDGIIVIQGDHREKIAEKLLALGYKSKFTGG